MPYIKKYFLIIIFIILILVNIITTPYYIVVPGKCVNLSENITVENGGKDAKGKFLLTSTIIIKANLFLYLYNFFDTNTDLKNYNKEYLVNLNQKEYIDVMDKLMQESQMIAKIVALKKVGYLPEILGQGILVNKILDHSSAKNKLLPGDLIVKVNDQSINNREEFSKIVQNHISSQIIKITFLRNNFTYSTLIPIIELPNPNNEIKKLGIGIYATNKDIECKLPLKIEVILDKIKGPSAGLMIALEILNQLTENDLSHGLIIAGTGNLEIDGKIYEVDNIKQKIISAKKQKADIFLVPQNNYQEALKFNQDIKIIPVIDFDDAITKLLEL